MAKYFQISVNEHKLILFTTILAFTVLLSSFLVLSVQIYNELVEKAELEKKYVAENNEEYPNITYCNFGETFPNVWSRINSFLWLPIIYLMLRENKTLNFFLSSLLTIIPFFNFLLWLKKTQILKSYQELSINNPNDTILYNSNSFDVILFLLISFLLIWQATILFRILLKKIIYEKPLS